MNLLVLNSGSSSIKFSVFAQNEQRSELSLLLDGELSGMKAPGAKLAVTQSSREPEEQSVEGTQTPAGAIGVVLDALQRAGVGAVAAVGYRVVHPGAEIQDHVRITGDVLKKLEAAADFAPLHDPEVIAIIRETMQQMPDLPHFACFDTVFHRTLPQEASTYPVPKIYRERGVKRYGFHGLSCESVVRQMRLAGPLPSRIVIAHLGSGCSVTALLDGASVDTTMGLTPTGGIVMGTRPGDLDPGLILYLLHLLRQQSGVDAASAVEKMLNHDAGMVALTGLPNDMKGIRKAASEGDAAAILALKVFTRSVRKAIGGFAWLLGGLDAIVFTGGIGEHDAATRAEVLAGTEVSVDSALNQAKGDHLRSIGASDCKTAIFVVPAQEDLVIAHHVLRMLGADA